MRTFFSSTLLVYLMLFLMPSQTFAQTDPVESLLRQMTLTEKVGQMAQMTIDIISVGQPFNLKDPHTLDPARLKKAINRYGVGSFLNISGHAYSRAHWYEVHQAIDEAVQETRLKIPVLYGIDGIHGMNYTLDATLFPQQMGQAATFHPELVEAGSAIAAYECRASGIPWNFSPVLDLMRQPLWSRVFETYGEDVHLATVMGVAAIKGYQGDDIGAKDKVAACMKHYLGYSFPFSGKDRTPAHIGELTLREYFLPTFQAAVDAGAATIMVNSAEINGIPVHTDPFILKTLLRDELGFKGVAVSDWEDILLLHKRHRVAASHKEAIEMAINAGIDMSMVPLELEFCDLLVELVEEGRVPMSRIDEAVRRILQLKMDLGLFDQLLFDFDAYPDFASEKHQTAALNMARESMTLLKNEKGILPLQADQQVLVVGPTANSQIMLNGAWSRTWQGVDPRWETKGKLTIMEAMRAEAGSGQVSFAEGVSVSEAIDIKGAVAAARKADVIVACLGEAPSVEKPGDIVSLDMSTPQLDLMKALAKTGKPIVLVLVENRPRIISEIEPLAAAVLMAYQPGEEGSKAISEVLYGKFNPGGKLPFTYPRYANDYMTYDRKATEDISIDFGRSAFKPQYPFGHGLSYTSFAYRNLSLSTDKLEGSQSITISVEVKNTGDRAGHETVMLFVQDLYASVTPAVKRLRAFEKLYLEAGATQKLSFQLQPEDLAFVGRDMKWVTESGTFKVMIGDKEAEFSYRQ